MFDQFIKTYEQRKTAENKVKAISELLKESFKEEGIQKKIHNGYIFHHKNQSSYSFPKEVNELLNKYNVLHYVVSLTKKQEKELGLEDYVIQTGNKTFGFSAKTSKIDVIKVDEHKEVYSNYSQDELLALLTEAKLEETKLKKEEETLKTVCKTDSTEMLKTVKTELKAQLEEDIKAFNKELETANDKKAKTISGKIEKTKVKLDNLDEVVADTGITFDWGTFKWKEETELDYAKIQKERPEVLLEGKISRKELNDRIDFGLFDDSFNEDYDDVISQLRNLEIKTVKEPTIEIISEESHKSIMSMLK
jgi:hypothetical protein